MAVGDIRELRQKLCVFLTTRLLALKSFGTFVQGAMLTLVVLDTNVTLLLKRDAAKGYVPDDIHDWVQVSAAVVEFTFGALIAWWGQARKNMALSGWLVAAAASGLLVLAFPFEEATEYSVELCGGEKVAALSHRSNFHGDPNVVPRIAVLVMTAAFCAIGRLSVWAHGLTYLDDHEPENGAYFYGMLISIRLSLGLNCVSWLEPFAMRPSWWIIQLIICGLALFFAFVFTLFPKRMEKYKLLEGELADRGLLQTLGRVVRSKTVLLQSAALSCLYAAVFSFIRFDSDFVQAQFHVETVRQDPRASRAITDRFRTFVVILFIMLFRTYFSVRRTVGVKARTAARVGGLVAILLVVPFTILAAIRCEIGDVGGSGQSYVQPWCSTHCRCESERYGFSPVCAVNTSTTYFSPCHAGCRSYTDLNGFLVFEECACAGGVAARGACSLPACISAFNDYQLMFALLLAFGGASLLMQGMVLLRSVAVSDKTVAVGVSFATIALLSHVPGYLLYMLISHLSCAFSYNGGCLLHNPTLWSMAVLSAGLSVVSGLLSLISSRVAKDL